MLDFKRRVPPIVMGVGPGLISALEREFFVDNLLVRIHVFIEMIRWTGLAPWGFEFPFPGSQPTAGLVDLLLTSHQKSTFYLYLKMVDSP